MGGGSWRMFDLGSLDEPARCCTWPISTKLGSKLDSASTLQRLTRGWNATAFQATSGVKPGCLGRGQGFSSSMTATRVHRGLVALSASAVAACIWLATCAPSRRTRRSAWPRTGTASPLLPHVFPSQRFRSPGARPVAETLSAPLPPTPLVLAPSAASTANPSTPTLAPAVPTAAPTAATTLTQQGYKDGTYSGQGSSRRGGVVVNVVVQNGRIASVTIASSTLQYPVRDIAGLPAQVVQRQSAQVDTVSRATYSSQAFRGAISAALAQAV